MTPVSPSKTISGRQLLVRGPPGPQEAIRKWRAAINAPTSSPLPPLLFLGLTSIERPQGSPGRPSLHQDSGFVQLLDLLIAHAKDVFKDMFSIGS